MCIKIGGYVRFEASYNTNGSSTRTQGGDLSNRYTNELWYRVRGYITADARDQTEYGTVRGYIALPVSAPTQPLIRRRRSTRTAPSSSGRASRSAARSRSSTSSRRQRWDTWASRRTPTPATAAGKWLATLPSWATASRPPSPPKIGVRRRSSGRASRLVILPPLSMVWAFQVKLSPRTSASSMVVLVPRR